jgi:hypothetical protein
MRSRLAKDQAGLQSRLRPGAGPASRESERDLERGAGVGGIQGRRNPTLPPTLEPAAQCNWLIAALVLASGQVDDVDDQDPQPANGARRSWQRPVWGRATTFCVPSLAEDWSAIGPLKREKPG